MATVDQGVRAEVRLTTWNLQGRQRPDVDVVAAVLAAARPDVVVLQEVQRRQAAALAAALGWAHVWRFKHWPVLIPVEGLAVLSSASITADETIAVARRWFWWSSRRRIAVAVDLEVRGRTNRVVCVHLGAGVGDRERLRQADLVSGLASRLPAGGASSVIAGDLNTRPDSVVIRRLAASGHRDAWVTRHGDEPGPTNWSAGPRDGPPVNRLDYVLVDAASTVVDAELPGHGDPGFERFAALSDHLPLTVTIDPAPGSGPGRQR